MESEQNRPSGAFVASQAGIDAWEKMWTIYLSEAEKHDKAVAAGWKDDAGSVLIFTGLFSTVVASFIIEGYKYLSPSTSDETVSLLRQISSQLAALSNHTGVGAIPAPSTQFSPRVPMVCANMLWAASFLLSTACALCATLVHQWARQYFQPSQLAMAPRDRARVRSFIFLGAEKYGISTVVRIIPLLLHISVLLFFIGLVIFFFMISIPVATITTVILVSSVVWYLMLTILPVLDFSCPYRTPLYTLFCVLAAWLLPIAIRIIRRFESFVRLLFVLPRGSRGDDSPRPVPIITWARKFLDKVDTHHKLCRETGLQNTIVYQALKASQGVDIQGLLWVLKAQVLSDAKVEELVSEMPGTLLLRLIQPSTPVRQAASNVLGGCISSLLQTCVSSNTGSLSDGIRIRRFRNCINAIYRGAMACNMQNAILPRETGHLTPTPLIVLAKTEPIRGALMDHNPGVRVSLSCVHALLARWSIRASPAWPWDSEQAAVSWLLPASLARYPVSTISQPVDTATRDTWILDAFVHEVISSLPANSLPSDTATMFVDTLAILMNEFDVRGSDVHGRLGALIEIADGSPKLGGRVADTLRKIFYGTFPAVTMPTPQISPLGDHARSHTGSSSMSC
ncbi:hypothetical protein BC834DRAFT_969662 [Gloeopeniophorella convolvens]|nr:hypothetical protein BC834DRAFT_969662 [Gloeopeniophorella convolvens]